MFKQEKQLFQTIQAQAWSAKTLLIKYISVEAHIEISRPEIQIPVWCVDIIPEKKHFGLG